jgi:hypothetical protein
MSAGSTKILIDPVDHVGQTGATILVGFHLTRGRCCFHLVARTGPAKCMISELEGTKASQAALAACGATSEGVQTNMPECP